MLTLSTVRLLFMINSSDIYGCYSGTPSCHYAKLSIKSKQRTQFFFTRQRKGYHLAPCACTKNELPSPGCTKELADFKAPRQMGML